MNNVSSLQHHRIDWVDYAKGICIIAVVVFYATGYVENSLHSNGWMHPLVVFAQPFRMPDFFLISGLFLSRVIDRPLRAYIDSKILHFVYFYVLWITIRLLAQDGVNLFGPDWRTILADYFHLYIQPHGQLWFIYMLPVFFLAARLLRSLPPLLVIAAAILLKLAEIDTEWKLIDRFGMYFVFFYSGHVFAPQIFRMADWARDNVRQAALVLGLWFIFNGMMVLLDWSYLPGMQLLMGYAGGVAILLLSALLANLPWMRWLRYLGQHSIVIYLAFVIPMAVMRMLIVKFHLIEDVGTISLLVVVASIAGAVAIYWSVRSTPLEFLFKRPTWASIQPPRVAMPQPLA